jgi:hypothetical protein
VLAEDVRRFILTSVASVPHLEALLLLRRERELEWDPTMLARRLYIPEKTARGLLADLAEAGFANCGNAGAPAYRFRPSTPEQDDIVRRVAEAYASNLIEVTNLIHGRSALLFAEAFRIRRD